MIVLCLCTSVVVTGTYPANHQGVIKTPKTLDFGENDTQFNLVRLFVNIESKGIFHKYYSYKTI